MPERGLIHKKLWGRSLGGVLAAVVMMALAAYAAIRWYWAGLLANKYVSRTDYVLAKLEYQEWMWGSLGIVSFILAYSLLGVGSRPALTTGDSRRKWETLPLEDRFDRVLYRFRMFKERHERWFLPIRHFLGRLVVVVVGTVVILFLQLIGIWVLDDYF